MTCIIDRAQKYIERQNALSLNAHQARIQETPTIDEHGQHLCLGCCESIPVKRILAQAHAARCIECQTLKERQGG